MNLDGETASPATEAADAAFDTALDQALSSETPAKDSGAPAQSAAVAETPPAAVPRDEQGRFADKPAAEELAPVAEPAKAPDAPVESTAEAEAQPEAEAAAAETAPELTYRYEGEEVGIPGSAVGSDGVFIPTTVAPEYLELIALGRSAREGTIRQRLSETGEQLSRKDKLIEAARAEALHVVSAIDDMIEKGTFGEFLEDQANRWPILKAEAKVKAKEAELAATHERLENFEQQQERTRLEPQIRSALERTVSHYGQKAGLTQQAMQALYDRLNTPRYRSQIIERAAADDPVKGVKRGEYLVNYGIVADEVEWLKQNGGAKPPAATRAQELAVENARLLGKPSTAPPTAAGKRGAAPPAKAAVPQFKTAEEADEAIFDQGGYAKL